jgi:hypothetical protein
VPSVLTRETRARQGGRLAKPGRAGATQQVGSLPVGRFDMGGVGFSHEPRRTAEAHESASVQESGAQ